MDNFFSPVYNDFERMSFIKKFLVVVIVILILFGAFYFIFNRPEKSGATRNPFLDLFSGRSENTADGNLLSGPEEFIAGKAVSVKESIQEKGGEILTSLKDGVSGVVDAVGAKFGIQEDNTDKVQAVLSGDIAVLPVAKAGARAYFLISSPAPSREIEYEIDWGDGSVEKGTLVGENATISHSWDKGGEFPVTFKTLGSDALSKSIKVFVTR